MADKWEAQNAIDALLEYMHQRGLKRYRPGQLPTDTEGYTFFPDGSSMTIEIRLGLPANFCRE